MVWRLTGLLCAALLQLMPGCAAGPSASAGALIAYDPLHYPGIICVAGRVVAETHPSLSDHERMELWHEYGLSPTFEWICRDSGFSYSELDVTPSTLRERITSFITRAELPPRELSKLVPLLDRDPRVNWAAPDALIFEWADDGSLADIVDELEAAGAESSGGQTAEEQAEQAAAEAEQAALAASERDPAQYSGTVLQGELGVVLLDAQYNLFGGTLPQWEQLENPAPPLPDFEYYRFAPPAGADVRWPAELAASAEFMQHYSRLHGTGQKLALNDYVAAGEPALSNITICVADTGLLLNHYDLAERLHPNAIDTNYRNYKIAGPNERPPAEFEIHDRESRESIGLPRTAIKGRPASHGTEVAGVVQRCTAGFKGADGADAIRILPASIKSASTVRITGWRAKSPISAFVKLIAMLKDEFPTGDFSPSPNDTVQNTGDVRVVTVSASVPKSYFSETEWRIVANLAGKAAGSIAEDLRENDRVYLFAAGNEAQSQPNQPCDQPYVLGVAAADCWRAGMAWDMGGRGKQREASNLGMTCVSAPGWGIVTSDLYDCPNLAYLPADEIANPRPDTSIPPRNAPWQTTTNRFSATSSATPQVASLAALLYAQDPSREYGGVIAIIRESTGGRTISADYGEAMGIVDFRAALNQH